MTNHEPQTPEDISNARYMDCAVAIHTKPKIMRNRIDKITHIIVYVPMQQQLLVILPVLM